MMLLLPSLATTLTTLTTLLHSMPLAAADSLEITKGCHTNGTTVLCRILETTYDAPGGRRNLNVENNVDGCLYGAATGVPSLNEICVDWLTGRGQFIYEGEARRCLVQEETVWWPNKDGCPEADCWTSRWRERECTWDRAACSN